MRQVFVFQPVFDEVQQCPYVVADNMFIGYDNPRSWQSKIRWMKKSGYGGVIVWALDLDDFNGTFCDQGKKMIFIIQQSVDSGDTDCDGQTRFLVACTRLYKPLCRPVGRSVAVGSEHATKAFFFKSIGLVPS